MSDKNKPVTFDLPDGDSISLISWGYVLEKATEFLNPINTAITGINTALTAINTKLDDWIKD